MLPLPLPYARLRHADGRYASAIVSPLRRHVDIRHATVSRRCRTLMLPPALPILRASAIFDAAFTLRAADSAMLIIIHGFIT